MATLTFQKAGWALSITRTSRAFAVSIAANLPKRRHHHHNLPEIPNLHSSRRHRSHRSPTVDSASIRRSFATTRVFQAQQAQQSTAPASLSSVPQSSPPATSPSEPYDLQSGLLDQPVLLDENSRQVDWTRSFHGLSDAAFSPETAEILLAPIPADDIEVKPDGIIYLPEIKYRRILNRALGPGAWGLAPRGETIVTARSVTREYALVALGRLVSIARGEMEYFNPEGIPNAVEGCKSNALMRCCKDLGIASELWDPRFIRRFMKENAKEQWVVHQVTNKRKKVWMRKDDTVRYPFKMAMANS